MGLLWMLQLGDLEVVMDQLVLPEAISVASMSYLQAIRVPLARGRVSPGPQGICGMVSIEWTIMPRDCLAVPTEKGRPVMQVAEEMIITLVAAVAEMGVQVVLEATE